MNQDKDPIADREAKIAAWRKKARLCPCEGDYLLTDEEIDEGVALMRSAPQDGDAKLRELRDWACESSCDTDCGDAVRLPPLLREIDRLLSKPSEPAPSAEIDRLRAENARLQADLAAAVKAHQFAEASQKVEQGLAKSAEARVAHLERDLAAARVALGRISEAVCPAGWTEPQDVVDRVLQRVEQRKQSDRMFQKLVDDLNADLAAARADQAAMARRELEWLRAAMDRWAKAVMDLTPTSGYRLDAINDVASTIRMRLAALPSQQPEPEPAAEAFRDAAKNCTGEMFGEQAAVKANGRNTVLMQPKPEVCGAPMRIVTGGTCANTKPCPTHDSEPVQWMAAGPDPYAATRDGDEVLREWLDPDTEGRPISGWVAVMARVLDEVCRRELARGGK